MAKYDKDCNWLCSLLNISKVCVILGQPSYIYNKLVHGNVSW